MTLIMCLCSLVRIFCFVNKRKHLLLSLLSIEITMVTSLIPFFLCARECLTSFMVIPFLVFSVVEAAVGLSILVRLSSVSRRDIVSR